MVDCPHGKEIFPNVQSEHPWHSCALSHMSVKKKKIPQNKTQGVYIGIAKFGSSST